MVGIVRRSGLGNCGHPYHSCLHTQEQVVVEKVGMIVWSLVVVQSGVVSVQGSAVYYHSQGTDVVAP